MSASQYGILCCLSRREIPPGSFSQSMPNGHRRRASGSRNMLANSGRVCGVLDVEFGRVASPIVAPQDRTLRMHAVESMVCFSCSGRFLIGGRGFTAPGYRRPSCKETPNVLASARNRCRFVIAPPAKWRLASLSSLGVSLCRLTYDDRVARSMTSATVTQ